MTCKWFLRLFPQVVQGKFVLKTVSELSLGDWKCCFQDVAIRLFLRVPDVTDEVPHDHNEEWCLIIKSIRVIFLGSNMGEHDDQRGL